MSEWISVKDRLPDKDGKYVVWYDGELNICEYDVESQTFGDSFYDYDEMHSKLLCWDDDINKFVTHWLLLAEPPKSEDDAE